MSIFLADEAATAALAARVLQALPKSPAGWTILLDGELGAGKSTFARALLRAMGHTGAVPSPTYTLDEPYPLSGIPVYHVDLYRVVDPEELRYLGFNELDDGFRLIEWPERAPELREKADLEIRLAYDGEGRVATFEGLSERGQTLISNFR